ncbi:MAG TPA: TetR/AcrR family transcriptional regulator [Terriglobia bacterium]|nr:TetR/AcrR family transcriptional regulator [Terriglobia bacterium]
MTVTREQAAANREKIVEVASILFRKHGFEGIGVADIMKAAGLTHGGFYGHFASKDDLAAEACARALSRGWWKGAISSSATCGLEAFVNAYLSPRHRSNPERGCIIAAVGSDIGRQARTVRRPFTKGLESLIEGLRNFMPGRSPAARRKQAVATLAGLVGALILSRAIDYPALSDEILESARTTFGHS